MDDILNLENNPSIKELGSQFKLTKVEFWVDCSSGLPFDDEINKYVIDDDACVSNLGWHLTNISFVGTSDGAAETPEEDNGSDWITSWLEFCKKDNDYILGEQDLTWKPPLDMDNLAFVYLSKDASNTIHGKTESKEETSSIVVSDGLSGGVNPMQIHNEHLARLELTADSVGNIEVEDVLMQDYFKDISKYWFQRYLLFSKYDAGIKMDKEGWFSAPLICMQSTKVLVVERAMFLIVLPRCGWECYQKAPSYCNRYDPNKLSMQHFNAPFIESKTLIEFVTGTFHSCQKLEGRYGLFASTVGRTQVEKNFINGNLKAITAYFTDPVLQD
ncbi:hypothetical protein Tco_1407944 [Tanacetum coccineum]